MALQVHLPTTVPRRSLAPQKIYVDFKLSPSINVPAWSPRRLVSARGAAGAGAFRPSSRPKPTRIVKGRPQMDGNGDDSPAMNEDIRYDWRRKPTAVTNTVNKTTRNTRKGYYLPRGATKWLHRSDPVCVPPYLLCAHSPFIRFSVCFTSLYA